MVVSPRASANAHFRALHITYKELKMPGKRSGITFLVTLAAICLAALDLWLNISTLQIMQPSGSWPQAFAVAVISAMAMEITIVNWPRLPKIVKTAIKVLCVIGGVLLAALFFYVLNIIAGEKMATFFVDILLAALAVTALDWIRGHRQ